MSQQDDDTAAPLPWWGMALVVALLGAVLAVAAGWWP